MTNSTLFPELVFDDIESLKTVYVRKAQRLALRIALDHGEVCIDGIREQIELPEGISPKVNGEVMALFRRLRYFRHGRWELSRRRCAHARPVSLWKLIDPSRARAWLKSHPDIPWPESYQPTINVSPELASGETSN